MTFFRDGLRSGGRLHFDPPHPPVSVAGGDATVHLVAASPDLVSAVGTDRASVRRYGSGEAFLAAEPWASGCLVCEVELPGMSGFDLQERLRGAEFRLPVVLASGRGQVADAVRAMRNGATTFLRLPCPADEIRGAVAEALALVRSSDVRETNRRTAAERFESLGVADAAVLEMLLDGLPNKAVAIRLGIGLRTVERRRATALRTLGVDSIVAAALLRSEAAAGRASIGGRVTV